MTLLINELKRLQSQHGFPGATLAFAREDGVVEELAVGFADLEKRVSMIPRSRMLAASIGKTFVAATVLALAKEGSLRLEDPLAHFLDKQSWYCRLPNGKNITLFHLLTHTSGLSDHVHTKGFEELLFRKKWPEERPFHPEILTQFILDQPPLFEAGKGWAYTDTGYVLLGLVIEKVTGHSAYSEIEKRFLKPLKLKETSPSDQQRLPGLVPGYAPKDNRFHLPEKTMSETGALVWNPVVEWMGGGFVSTSHDLALWAKLLYEGRAMPFEYLPDLLRSVPIGNENRFGAAVLINPNDPPEEKWGHGGIIPGYASSMRYYPKSRVSIAFQLNTDRNVASFASEMEQRLAQIILSH